MTFTVDPYRLFVCFCLLAIVAVYAWACAAGWFTPPAPVVLRLVVAEDAPS